VFPLPYSRSDTALVLIDMQTDFLCADGRLGSKYDIATLDMLKSTTASVGKLLAAARKAGLTIAHSRSHRYGASVRVDLARSDPLDEGYELVPELRALPGEIVVDKWTFGAFGYTTY
jgi:nicotinamidase-related amidase